MEKVGRWEDSEVERLERWEGSERVVRWQVGNGERVVRWKGRECGRVVKWQGGRFLILFEGWGCRVSPRFHLVSVNQQNEGAGWVNIFLHDHRNGKTLLRSYTSR